MAPPRGRCWSTPEAEAAPPCPGRLAGMLSWNGGSPRSEPQSWAQALVVPHPERGFFLEGLQKPLGSQSFPLSVGLSQRLGQMFWSELFQLSPSTGLGWVWESRANTRSSRAHRAGVRLSRWAQQLASAPLRMRIWAEMWGTCRRRCFDLGWSQAWEVSPFPVWSCLPSCFQGLEQDKEKPGAAGERMLVLV